MSELVQKVLAIREKTWAQEPEDVKNLLDPTKGYTDTWDSCFFPTLYAWEETVASRNVFYVIRQTLMQDDVDFKTVRRLAQNLTAMYVPFIKWANMPEAEKLFQEAAAQMDTIATSEELIQLLEELICYTARLNYWIEPHMPWTEMIGAFNAAAT
jgi:hypothetical protein